MSETVIRVKDLSRQFGDLKAIQHLNLEISKGNIYGFLGPNGCGKTTAIRLLTGLLKPTSGSVNVLGYELPKDAEKLRMHIGYMTQKFSLYDDLSVAENLKFISNIYGVSGAQQKHRLDELLSTYDLQQQKNQLAGSMSGGQKQRLALAAAVIHKPELLFLDEPTSAVDPENRRDFWEQLFDLSDQGTSILVSTHYMDEAERCHKLAILEKGVKKADGSPAQLMEKMGAYVVEISANELRELKKELIKLAPVMSAAQLGERLRVLVKKTVDEPVQYLQQQECVPESALLSLVRPSLEDVFVMSTGERHL